MNCDPHHDMAIGVELHFDKAVITGSYTIKEKSMKETKLTLPEVALIGGTRVMLGAGIALLLSPKVGAEQRGAIGWTLFLIGAISTIPLAVNVLGKRQ